MPDVTVGGIGSAIEQVVVEPALKWRERRQREFAAAVERAKRVVVGDDPNPVYTGPLDAAAIDALARKQLLIDDLKRTWGARVNAEGVAVGDGGGVVVDVAPKWRGDP